jgi:hypothetical protein
VACPHEPPDKVGAHPAETDHAKLHAVLPCSSAAVPDCEDATRR